MTATVVCYPAHPEDEINTIKVVCEPCDIEFGWRADTPAGNERLEDLADIHNIRVHGHRRLPWVSQK